MNFKTYCIEEVGIDKINANDSFHLHTSKIQITQHSSILWMIKENNFN